VRPAPCEAGRTQSCVYELLLEELPVELELLLLDDELLEELLDELLLVELLDDELALVVELTLLELDDDTLAAVEELLEELLDALLVELLLLEDELELDESISCPVWRLNFFVKIPNSVQTIIWRNTRSFGAALRAFQNSRCVDRGVSGP
jgi:hypothetical protein